MKPSRPQPDARAIMHAMAQLMGQPPPQVPALHPTPPVPFYGNAAFGQPYMMLGPPPPPSNQGETWNISLSVIPPNSREPSAVSWLIDSGASIHVTNDFSLLHSPTMHTSPLPLNLATSDGVGAIHATGSVCFQNARGEVLWLHHVHFVPSATVNLLSVSAAIRDGATFTCDPKGAYTRMTGPQGWECTVIHNRGLFFLQNVLPRATQVDNGGSASALGASGSSLSHECSKRILWHKRLGHPGDKNMIRLEAEGMVTGLDTGLRPCDCCSGPCFACVEGKYARSPFGKSSRPATKPLERIHVDTVGPVNPVALTGEVYWVTVVDEYTHYVATLTVKNKDQVSERLVELLKLWENQLGSRIKCVRSDRGTEFLNSRFKGFCAEQGISIETSAPYTPQQNGVAERMNRTLKEKTNCLLHQARASQVLWKEALSTATHLYNLGPTSGKIVTPWEGFWGDKPDVSHLRVWGCSAHVYVPSQFRSTFDKRTVPGMFLGFEPGSKAARIMIAGRKVRVSRDVIFVESHLGAVNVGLQQPYENDSSHSSPSLNPWQQKHLRETVTDHTQPSVDFGLPCEGPSPSDTGRQRGESETGVVFGEDTESDDEDAVLHPQSQTPSPSYQDHLGTVGTKPGQASDAGPQPSWSMLRHLKHLARGGSGTTSQIRRMDAAQGQLRPSHHPVDKTEAQAAQRRERYDRRNAAKNPTVGLNMTEIQNNDAGGIASSGEVDEECDAMLGRESDEEVEEEVGVRYISKPHHPKSESGREERLRIPPEWRHVRDSSSAGRDNGSRETGEVLRECVNGGQAGLDFNLLAGNAVPGVKFSKVHIPANLQEARSSPQWEYWETAMQEEQNSLDAHEVMEYVTRPRGHKVLPVHWIFSVKVDEFGNVIRFKARLVAQGCRQIPGVDVDEVFAPTSSFGARRALLAVAAAKDFEIHQVDIKTAFLNGELEEEVYVTQPPGFDNGDSRVVCRLKKALYGLKQAPRAWHKTLNDKLQAMGYAVCKSDAGVYVRTDIKGEKSYILVYVDDLLIVSKSTGEVDRCKTMLLTDFKIHDLGPVKDFLGCQIRRDRVNHRLYMSCTPKIEALAEKFGVVLDGKGAETPMSKDFCHTKFPVSECDGERVGAGTPLAPGHRYCELLGSLLYIANTTRPDISHAVGVLSRYRMSPTTSHWNEAIRVLRYLVETRLKALVLGEGEDVLVGYVDADYAGDLDHRYSTSGFLLSVFGGAAVWGSKKQSAVATSTVEAEFMAASLAIKEATWLKGFMEEIGYPPWSLKLYCDNQGCIANLRNPLYSKYTKHIAVSFHYAREAIGKGQVDIQYVESSRNMADLFTKSLAKPIYVKHRESVGVKDIM